MSADNTLEVIQGWSEILQQAIALGQYTFPIAMRVEFPSLRKDLMSDGKILEKDQEIAKLFRERVWPLFSTDKIDVYGSRLRQDYPWLLDFEKAETEEFPAASLHFEHDHSDLICILNAYGTLIDCEVVQSQLLANLRNGLAAMIRPHRGYQSRRSPLSRLLQRFKKLRDVTDDNQFIEEYKNIDYFAINNHCLRKYRDDRLGWVKSVPTGDYPWENISGRIRQFIRLAHETSAEFKNLSSYILSLRTKALARSSESREKELQAGIQKLQEDQVKLQEDKKKLQQDNEKLREDNEKLKEDRKKLQDEKAKLREENEKLQEDTKKRQEEKTKLREDNKKLQEDKEKHRKRLEVFDRALTDMSYRHLLEMLPTVKHAATGTPIELNPISTPGWEAFWRDAWTAAVDGKPGPLNDLYQRSNKRGRIEIKEEGGRLYGVLSANLHDFENEYDIDMGVRDKIPGLILSALKPQNFTDDGDVDWDQEVRRFV